MLKRVGFVAVIALLLSLATVTPTLAAPSVALSYSGMTNIGVEGAIDLSDYVTVGIRVGTVLDPDYISSFDGQIGLRFYLNAPAPLRPFFSLYAGAACYYDFSGYQSTQFEVTGSLGGGLEYSPEDNGTFISAGFECHWYQEKLWPGYSWAFRVGKRF